MKQKNITKYGKIDALGPSNNGCRIEALTKAGGADKGEQCVKMGGKISAKSVKNRSQSSTENDVEKHTPTNSKGFNNDFQIGFKK